MGEALANALRDATSAGRFKLARAILDELRAWREWGTP
jgi:hypothetical protein